jgi:hypothetical protein
MCWLIARFSIDAYDAKKFCLIFWVLFPYDVNFMLTYAKQQGVQVYKLKEKHATP